VQLIDAGRRPAEVAREIGVVEQTLHNWLKRSVDSGSVMGRA